MNASPLGSRSDNSMVDTDIPARLDRLPWGRFHTLVVVALGVTWILDGLEVTLAGALAGAFKNSPILHFSDTEIGLVSSAYLAGAVLGAIVFGWLTDRLARKKLFFITLSVYLTATAATAGSWNLWSFALLRFLTGAGIGGEYTAINSAIQELIPKQYRGRTDLAINGSFWIGAAIGAASSVVLLNPAVIDPEVGWRAAFLIGAALALIVFLMRLWIPESPRWLITHGRTTQAEETLAGIERMFGRQYQVSHDLPRVRLRARRFTPLREVADTLFHLHRKRALVGLCLMAAQAFFYNGIFFTYALILTEFFGISADHVGEYLLPFAAGNFFGPLLLGPLFDTVGRKKMIAFTYGISGVLLAASGYLFMIGATSATTETLARMIIFFFASAAASSAYLTVSETFPLEIRALAIALFFAIGTSVGIVGPLLFGALIETGSRAFVFGGYLLAASLMVAAALVQLRFGIAAERKALEDIAPPLAFAE
jgi:MFS family permease